MSGQRATLAATAQAATTPLAVPSGAVKGTGFYIAPDFVVTCAHVVAQDGQPSNFVTGRAGLRFEVLPDWFYPGGPDGLDLALLRADTPAAQPVFLAEPVAPGDDLWVFGYPEGNYRAGDSASLQLEGISEHVGGPVLLKGHQGRIRPGMSGGPVLNWRTGAVCGMVRYRDGTHSDTMRFVPTKTIFAAYPGLAEANGAAARGWLELLDDDQISAAGVCFPGPLMRRYLRAASTVDDTHPYAAMLDIRSPLARVYLRQRVTAEEPADLVEASHLLQNGAGAQVLGGPGAGKSSLARHLTATSARQWLDEGTGTVVPILVTAEALTRSQGLTEMLAEGAVQTLDTDLDRATLISLFGARPFPGADWLVLVDGVDEILYPYLREAVLSKIARHRAEGRYRFLLTTRPLPAYLLDRVAENGQYPTFVIEPFGQHELEIFAAKWFTQLHLPDPDNAAADFGHRVDEVSIGHLATIPLIATMLCILYANAPEQRLPGNRAELYAEFVELLLAKRRITNVRERLAGWTGRSGDGAVAAGEELLNRTPELLKLLAYSHFRAADPLFSGGEPEAVAVIAGEIARPAELPSSDWASVIREVLRSCGLLVERRGGFTFIHQTVQEYLAAAHLADQHPDPRRRSARNLLVPKKWPRQDLEVLTFLAALWAKDGRDLHPVLNRFLSRRQRNENYRFVLELHQQGVRLPQRTKAKLTDLLVRWIRDPGRSNEDWRAAGQALSQISPQRATDVFRQITTSASSWQRRFDSSVFLLDHETAAGIQALEDIATDEQVGGSERLIAARKLHEHHPARGVAALARIAEKIEPDNLRAEAAIFVADHDPERGIQLLRNLTRDSRVEGVTRLRAARSLGKHDAGKALTELSKQRTVAGQIRLDAARTAAYWLPDNGADLLIALTRDGEIDASFRFSAAEQLTQRGNHAGPTGLEAVARSKEARTSVRIGAAERAAQINPVTGLALQLDLVADPSMGSDRITMALAAGRLDPTAAAAALVRVAGDVSQVDPVNRSWWETSSVEFRIRAAQAAAKLDLGLGLPALETLVFDPEIEPKARIKAADAATLADRSSGLELYRRLVENPETSAGLRGDAAVKLLQLDGALGWQTVLALLSDPACIVSPDGLLSLGTRIGQSDQGLGIQVLRHVAMKTAVNPRIRFDAVTAVTMLDWDEGSRLATEAGTDPAIIHYLRTRPDM